MTCKTRSRDARSSQKWVNRFKKKSIFFKKKKEEKIEFLRVRNDTAADRDRSPIRRLRFPPFGRNIPRILLTLDFLVLSLFQRSHFHVSVNQISFFPFDGSPLVDGTPRDHVLRLIGWWNVTWLKKNSLKMTFSCESWPIYHKSHRGDLSRKSPRWDLTLKIYPNQVDDEVKEIERGRGRWTGSENGLRAFGSRSDFLSIGTEMMSVSQFGVHLASAWSTDACH